MRYGELASALAIHSFSRILPSIEKSIRIPLSDNLFTFVAGHRSATLVLAEKGSESLTIVDMIYGLFN